MSAKKFKFVSPGVFLNEIDNSQLTKTSDSLGPVIIGRARRGPALRPVRIESFSEFVEIFGDPVAGGEGSDVWREGNGKLAPTYAAYAAQAYLRNAAPINFVRLLGVQDSEASVDKGEAGWASSNAYALIVGQATASSAATSDTAAGTVAAIFYGASSNINIRLKGNELAHAAGKGDEDIVNLTEASNTHRFVRGTATSASFSAGGTPEWIAEVYDGTTKKESISFNFDRSSPKYLRKVFNTNPTLTNGEIAATTKQYWLGESFENNISLSPAWTKASVTFAFSDAQVAEETITLESSDGTSKIYQAKADGVTNGTEDTGKVVFGRGNGGADAGAKAIVAATSLAAAINHANGHKDKLIAVATGASITITQANATAAGNTAIARSASWDAQIVNPDPTAMTGGSSTLPFALTLPYGLATKLDGEDRREEMKAGGTNWFISQDMEATATDFDAENVQKLFRLVALDSGVEAQNSYKISIKDIVAARKDSPNPYGSFTVVVRDVKDSDIAIKVVEQFTNCNLNPNSSNYVARKIGDMYQEWDSAERRYKTYGGHPNLSRIFRVVMDSDVDAGSADPELLPFGFLGIPKLKDLTIATATVPTTGWLGDISVEPPTLPAGNLFYIGTDVGLTVQYPDISLRVSASHGSISNPKDAYFGVWTHRSTSSIRHADSYVDSVARLPVDVSGETLIPAADGLTQYSWIFTLDDIVQADSAGVANQGKLFAHISGSRQVAAPATRSITALGSTGYRAVLDAGINKFTAPVYGGTDGVDITESEAFNNRVLRNQNERDSYEFASVRRALDAVADPEVVECNMMAMPGISADGLTKQMLTNCESRADALAVIDIDAVFTPAGEATKTNFKERLGDGVDTVTDAFELRGINSSYGCTYYPWVKIHDELNDQSVWAPPSVVAMGVMANTENRDALWFAPAGFNRGGLTEGSAGVPVLGVSERLTSKERDTLYDANINPIASFPSEGIVIFGQKTLQVTPSALDRINVRRLMIYVKKEVSRIAARLLFDQNVQTTWERFIKQVTPFLEGVKIGFGLSDFKVVLDSSTTTPDMVDRNIMYAKVFLKPAKAVEFIAVDFVITNTGAAFED